MRSPLRAAETCGNSNQPCSSFSKFHLLYATFKLPIYQLRSQVSLLRWQVPLYNNDRQVCADIIWKLIIMLKTWYEAFLTSACNTGIFSLSTSAVVYAFPTFAPLVSIDSPSPPALITRGDCYFKTEKAANLFGINKLTNLNLQWKKSRTPRHSFVHIANC